MDFDTCTDDEFKIIARGVVRARLSLERLRNVLISGHPEIIPDNPYITRVSKGRDILTGELHYTVEILLLHPGRTYSSRVAIFTRTELESQV